MSLRPAEIPRFCNSDPPVEVVSRRRFARPSFTKLLGYLRHCVLAVTQAGPAALDSFLDETLLVDRVTKLRAYLLAHPHVMVTLPPPDLVGRYSG